MDAAADVDGCTEGRLSQPNFFLLCIDNQNAIGHLTVIDGNEARADFVLI